MRQPRTLDRRTAVRRLAVLAAGVAATGCTPLRIALRLYPEEFDHDAGLSDRVLRAFVVTLIPAAPLDDANLVRALHDPYYPLAKYAGFLASDLCRRAHGLFGSEAFDRLTLEQRTRVIQDGLAADHVTARLYNGAIFLAQVAVYTGIYDGEHGSPLMGFEGRYRFRGLAAITHPDPARFLPSALTHDGNPA